MILSSIFNLMHIILPVIFSLTKKKRISLLLSILQNLKDQETVEKMTPFLTVLPAVESLPKLMIPAVLTLSVLM